MRDTDHLTPQVLGVEKYTVSTEGGVKVYAGTGFDPDNRQHRECSDAVRYAIAIQQYRDAKNWPASDVARKAAELLGFFVMQEVDGTRVKPKPIGWSRRTVNARKNFNVADMKCVVSDGFLWDGEVEFGQ